MRLLERESEIDSLTAWLAPVAEGKACIALVAGAAGLGTQSLLRLFSSGSRTAKGIPVRTLWGGCEALFTPHPLAPLYDIARQIGGNFPALLDAATRREAVFNLTIDALAHLAK